MFIVLRKLVFTAVAFFLCGLLGQINADTIEVRVSSSSDDAEENIDPAKGNGSMESLTSSDLELGSEFDSDPDAEGIQMAGIRFASVEIPVGATINSAFIQFTVDENDKNAAEANFGIIGELALDPAAFSSAAGNISSRDSTSAAVPWLNVPSWTGQVGTAGPDQATPDISAIVQEIINQDGWASGNAMAFGIAPIDPATGDFDTASLANRTAESFDGSAGSAPLLSVDYTPIPEPSGAVLVVLGLVATLNLRRRF